MDEFVQHVLRANAFGEKLQQLIEQGLALGGAAIKVWAEPISEGTGNRVQGTGDEYDVRLGYVAADQFVPISWDNANLYEGMFVSRVAKGKHFYTRLEWHRRTATGYAVDNELFRSDMENGVTRNEVDVVGTKNGRTYFISAKMQEPQKAFLEEIDVLARLFGVEGVPVLVCSHYSTARRGGGIAAPVSFIPFSSTPSAARPPPAGRV